MRSSRLAAFDQNNDGRLTLEEYQAMWLDAMRERMVDRFQAHDDDGDAVVTVEEFVELLQLDGPAPGPQRGWPADPRRSAPPARSWMMMMTRTNVARAILAAGSRCGLAGPVM